MSGGTGGSQTSKTEIPQWLENAARSNIAMGNDVANIGYTPYYGPDVAAFTPMQQASFQNTGQAANAFGMAGGGLMGMEGVPQPQQFEGGLLGYSSAPLYEQSMGQLQQNAPGQYQAIQDMFIDPQYGGGGYQGQSYGGGGSSGSGSRSFGQRLLNYTVPFTNFF